MLKIKGFGLGLMIMLAVSVILFMVEIMSVLLSGGRVPTYNLLAGMLLTWVAVVFVLLPYGSIPIGVTRNVFFSRTAFVWVIVLGWFLFREDSPWIFLLGMCVASVCVGYNIVLAHAEESF